MENATINISLPKPLLDSADKQAQTELRNRSELIREALRDYLMKRTSGEDSTYTANENSRLEFMTKLKPLSDDVSLYISAVLRPQPNAIPELFKGGDSPLTQLLENPPRFRHSGWDLQTLDRARPVAGEYLQLNNGNRKSLRLYRDGQFLFASDYDFLGHGVSKDDDNDEFSINGLAVAETLTNFVYFIHDYVKYASIMPNTAIIKIRLLNPKKTKMKLIAVQRRGEFNESFSNVVELELLDREIPITISENMDKNMNAYKILAEFFYFFGVTDNRFWYVNKESGTVNTEFFKEG